MNYLNYVGADGKYRRIKIKCSCCGSSDKPTKTFLKFGKYDYNTRRICKECFLENYPSNDWDVL